MGKKNTRDAIAGRAWRLLRLSLCWARKGGAFRRSFLRDLISRHLKTLGSADYNPHGERELSFEETPIFRSQIHGSTAKFRYLPHIPCINPPETPPTVSYFGALDDGFRSTGEANADLDRKSFGFFEEEEEDGRGEEDEGIDGRAEEFISRFYHQMKLQRQQSYLQYQEMLQRGAY